MNDQDPTDRTPFAQPNLTRHFSLMLLKFSKRKYLQKFRKGHLLLRPQAYFTRLENDSLREDRFETVDKIFQPRDIRSFRIGNDEFQVVGPVLVNLGRHAYNVFCMYSIPISRIGSPQVDPRNFGFGDSFVVVLNTQKFLNRVVRAAKKRGFGLDCHLVQYFDPDTYSSEVGPFRKPVNFEYQQEFRIVITPGTVKPIELEVGTLTDITTPIYPLADINSLIEMNVPPRSGSR